MQTVGFRVWYQPITPTCNNNLGFGELLHVVIATSPLQRLFVNTHVRHHILLWIHQLPVSALVCPAANE
jgi:hypothetical protein